MTAGKRTTPIEKLRDSEFRKRLDRAAKETGWKKNGGCGCSKVAGFKQRNGIGVRHEKQNKVGTESDVSSKGNQRKWREQVHSTAARERGRLTALRFPPNSLAAFRRLLRSRARIDHVGKRMKLPLEHWLERVYDLKDRRSMIKRKIIK